MLACSSLVVRVASALASDAGVQGGPRTRWTQTALPVHGAAAGTPGTLHSVELLSRRPVGAAPCCHYSHGALEAAAHCPQPPCRLTHPPTRTDRQCMHQSPPASHRLRMVPPLA